MCKKILTVAAIILCVSISSVPAWAAPGNTPFLAVDINGSGGPLQTTYPTGWPAWEGWSIDYQPMTFTFSNTFGSISVILTIENYDGVYPQTRNRSDPNGGNDEYLSNLYRDFIYVAHSSSVGWGWDYLQFDFSGLEPNKPYEFTVFNWDAFYTTGDEPPKHMAWGIECPADYPSYQPVVGGGGQAPKLARILMSGDDPCDPNILDAFYYSGSFTVKTDGSGEATIYGWADNESWTGSSHAPFNGFAIGKDPNANTPEPSDGETNVDLILTLSWEPGFWAQDTNAHHVYFGTDYTEVSDADTDTADIYLGNPTESSFQLSTALISGETYYWRVDEINDVNTPGYWKGQVWEFTAASLITTKCTVKAGKTQYAEQGPDANDVTKMKDRIVIAGTVVFPSDLNDITQIDVNIISAYDDELVYTESIDDFNAATDVIRNKYKYSCKIPKGAEGAITSMKLDFVKNTLAITAKNIDLTGLQSPIHIDLGMGATTLVGDVDETIINKARSIPTRLMRLYQDTLIATKVKARSSTRTLADSLSVKGEIAVADMDLDADSPEPNLIAQEVTLTWGDANGADTQTFIIPDGSFTKSKKGHIYKCRKIVMDTGDCNAGLVTAKIDLDKCIFTAAIKNADGLYVGPGDAEF
ncbi:MAG: hypothetical protein JW749_09825, partial [Sedimentisphaerales bacterium]|nr:hypothetical protein [Sedimentisphaerales bacterium]